MVLCRVKREVTHWTQAGPGQQHDATAPIAVEEIIKDAGGSEVQRSKAELGDVGGGAKAFIFKVLLPANAPVECCLCDQIQHIILVL